MSNAVYPSDLVGLNFTVTKSPKFSTIVQSSPGFTESRIIQSQNPIWSWLLAYDVLGNTARWIKTGQAYTDLQRLMGFYLARQGRFDSFLFNDPDDNTVGPGVAIGVPNTAAQLQVVTDGTNYYSPFQRNMGGVFYEDVTDFNVTNAAPILYANGAVQNVGSNYVILGPGLAYAGYTSGGLYAKWLTGAPTGPVTATFQYYFRVRFDADEQQFEKFVQNLWCIGGDQGQNSSNLKLITARTTMV